jgi:hypothetical protein
MLKPTRVAFLKHDLYKLDLQSDDWTRPFTLENAPEVKYKKVASKGLRFIYCTTDRKDAGMGWFADSGEGYLREGNCGFGKMSEGWAKENLTDPLPFEGKKFRDRWDRFPEIMNTPVEEDED